MARSFGIGPPVHFISIVMLERDLTNPMSVAKDFSQKKALQFIIKEVIPRRNLTNVVSVARSSVEEFPSVLVGILFGENLQNVMKYGKLFRHKNSFCNPSGIHTGEKPYNVMSV